jgi:ADP-ribosyl-[dinitrogen reductase] hydrolase
VFVRLACGDALGTTVEFQHREIFAPMTDMVGGGLFRLEPGQWTDDTSMALCVAVSLTELRHFNANDMMSRFVAGWIMVTWVAMDTVSTSDARYVKR